MFTYDSFILMLLLYYIITSFAVDYRSITLNYISQYNYQNIIFNVAELFLADAFNKYINECYFQ